MPGLLPDRPVMRQADNIEEVDYLSDIINDGETSDATENEESDWEGDMTALVPVTPQKIEFAEEAAANGAYPGYTPLQKQAPKEPKSLPPPRRGVLESIRSPPESIPRKPRFETATVDNRTRTPFFQPPQEEDDDSVDSDRQAPMNYGAGKYLHASPTLSRSSTPPVRQTPDRSVATFQTNRSANSRQYSVMSHRSSTSMSLLYGEVINLEDPSRMVSSDSNSPSRAVADKVDIESQSPLSLEGMQIGGGVRPGHALRGKPIPLHDIDSDGPKFVSFAVPHEALSSGYQNLKKAATRTTSTIKNAASQTIAVSKGLLHRYRPPLSPHARALDDLDYLQKTHKEKLGKLTENAVIREHYDFVLLLKPQEVYRFWAELLDFRVEHLGDEFLAAMDPIIETASTHSTETSDSEDAEDQIPHDYSTPLTGIRNRARTSELRQTPTPSTKARHIPRPSFAQSLFSPESHCGKMLTSSKSTKRRLSVFDKAIGVLSSPSTGAVDDSFGGESAGVPASATSVRRRWGNRQMHPRGSDTANILSPPVRSLTRGAASVRKLPVNVTPLPKTNEEDVDDSEEQENCDPKRVLTEEEFPNPVIPRGVAARTNGMLQFLSALKRGIVVRRHRPNREAVFCKIMSPDGGDTIQYQLIDTEEAMVAFKEQRVRYNKKFASSARDWACLNTAPDDNQAHNFNVPDHVAAHRYREKQSREHGVKKRIVDLATKAANSGIVRAADIVAVHPASHRDPRNPGVRRGELGTASLRRSKSEHFTPHTFSIVTNATQRFGTGRAGSSEETENKWYTGEGGELQFKVLDFETATEGDYWLVFRGFLLLHRDAAVGRFAAERKAGIGGGNRGRDREGEDGKEDENENMLHRDEFNEPVTVGCLERAMVKLRKLDNTYMKGSVAPTAVPPPSDYFLGFKSPGTQIWSRLRLAGLETSRIYAVDSRRVMIKVRCPEDRLTDVAEVLRVQMRTLDGSYAAFREDTADLFKPLNDKLDVPAIYHGRMASLLRSKDRQNIIDFIIGSRIRDSGAELGPTTDVGQMVQARIPLHVHEKLESLVQPWVFYWKLQNWTGIAASKKENGEENVEADPSTPERHQRDDRQQAAQPPPDFLTRFVVGAFHQPLDAIEEYFGEQVTFYFAWLQHCARHLVILTAVGVLVTICQLLSKDRRIDHPLRPYFSMVVMLWTFLVLINWKKRSNLLAYKWGSMDYKVQETPRPEFHGEYVVDEITQEWVVKYPKWKRWLKYLISVPISCFFTCFAVVAILLVHKNRDLQMADYIASKTNPDEPFRFRFEFSLQNLGTVENDSDELSNELLDPTFWVVMGALPAMLGLCIPLVNLLLMKIATMLNNFENYRTESEYRTHLIIKVFSFRFVSQFGAVYYYAFISMGEDQETNENGLIRMGTSVMIYTTIAHWWSIFLQVYFFMLVRNIRRYIYRLKLRQELKRTEIQEEENSRDLSDAEARQTRIINKRMLLDQAQDDLWFEIMNPPHNSFPEYITAVIQFSFVACFSVVLPITPLFCLLNHLLSMRYDAYKLCRGRRRPLAQKTGGIGVWEHLLHIVAVIAVLTNCWLIAFTASDFRWIAEEGGDIWLYGVVVAWEHVMLLVKYVMQTAISPLPRFVRDELKRQQHRLEKEQYSTMRAKNLDRRGKHEKEETKPIHPGNQLVEEKEEVTTNSPPVVTTPDFRTGRIHPLASNLYSC